jgi:hypothetical protein
MARKLRLILIKFYVGGLCFSAVLVLRRTYTSELNIHELKI